MAGKIRLKRSDTTGNVPTTGDLSLGELAVNTYDGKLFFKKNDGSDSLESIVTTNAQITGSLEMTGAVTASLTLIQNQSPGENVFTIKIGGQDKVYVENDGTLNVARLNVRADGGLKVPTKATLGTAVVGDTAVSESNFFIYL
jgi:hypothetical protein